MVNRLIPAHIAPVLSCADVSGKKCTAGYNMQILAQLTIFPCQCWKWTIGLCFFWTGSSTGDDDYPVWLVNLWAHLEPSNQMTSDHCSLSISILKDPPPFCRLLAAVSQQSLLAIGSAYFQLTCGFNMIKFALAHVLVIALVDIHEY